MSGRRRALYVFALLFALAPPGFGVVRYLATGRDLRGLAMAAASLIGAAIVFAMGRGRAPASRWSLIMLVVTTLLAWVAGIALGAVRGPGALMVAVVIGLCWAASYALYARARGTADAGINGR